MIETHNTETDLERPLLNLFESLEQEKIVKEQEKKSSTFEQSLTVKSCS